VPESIRNVCKASKTEVMLVGLGSDGCGCTSLNIDCNGPLEEPPRLFEKLCFKDAKPRLLDGGDDGTGDNGRLERLGERLVPFLGLGAGFFVGVKERRKDQSDSN